MTLVSNDPSWWVAINWIRVSSYFAVASSALVIYDWVLTFEQEIELVWKQRRSFMAILYLSVRYIGVLYSVLNILNCIPTFSMSDTLLVRYNNYNSCTVITLFRWWSVFFVMEMLDIIMIVRIHAMYQQSRMMLIFLVVTYAALTTTSIVITAMQSSYLSAEEAVLSGTYQCLEGGFSRLMISVVWMLSIVWEVTALCLATWIAVKHFREMHRRSKGWTVGDCFTVLIKSHVFYFAAYAVVSCYNVAALSPKLLDGVSVEAQMYDGAVRILTLMQLFVLGPRLILSIREYFAETVANSDEGTDMTTINFQEQVHISTSDGV